MEVEESVITIRFRTWIPGERLAFVCLLIEQRPRGGENVGYLFKFERRGGHSLPIK